MLDHHERIRAEGSSPGDDVIPRRAAAMFAVAAASFFSFTAGVGAAQQQEARWDLLAHEQEALTLRGYRAHTVLSFFLPAGLAPSRPLSLSMTARATRQIAADASLLVEVNGTPVDSLTLDAGSTTHGLSIAPGFVQPGENTVRLEAIIGLEIDSECIDPAHPARWLEITDVSLSGAFVVAEDLGIGDFPESHAPLGDLAGPNVAVVPESAGGDALSALAAVVFAVARSGIDVEWFISEMQEGSAAETAGPTVVIGDPDLDSEEGEGTIRLGRSPSGAAVLSIASTPQGSLASVGDALADPAMAATQTGGVLDVLRAPLRSPRQPPSSFTLEDVGYAQRAVQGPGAASLVYRFDVPFAWKPTVGSVRGDVVADPGRLSVWLNGRQIGSMALASDTAQHDLRAMALPATGLRPGRNFLRFTFELDVYPTCLPNDLSPAAAVPPALRIELPHRIAGGRIDLNDFPFLFLSEPDMTALTVAVPDDATATEIASGVLFVQALGGSSSRFAPRMVPSSELDEELRSGHVIVLGEARRQPLLEELRDLLPLELETDGTPSRTAELEEDGDRAGAGTAQIFASPWAENRVVMTITGPTSESFEAVLHAVLGGPTSETVAGPAILAGGPDASGTLDVTVMRSEIPPITEPSENFVSRIPLPFRIVFFIVVVVAVAAASTLFRRGTPDSV